MTVENKKKQSISSQSKNKKPSLLGYLFFIVFNILLLTLLSWMLLTGYFCIQEAILIGLNIRVENVIAIVVNTTKMSISRFYYFLSYLPFIGVIIFVFMTDGLVQRDIRKFKCARESALIFHKSKPLAALLFFMLFFLYMVMPIKITPELFLVPMAILSGYFTGLTIKNFKKYT